MSDILPSAWKIRAALLPVLLPALLVISQAACPTPTPTHRPGATDNRPRTPQKRYAEAKAPFVAVLPGARLYARPDSGAPFVQIGLTSDGKVPVRTCDQRTEMPVAMRALRQRQGWVEVETAVSRKAVGACIRRIVWSDRVRFRAWVHKDDLGTVVRKTVTVVYGDKLQVKLRAGSAVLALAGLPRKYCVQLKLPRWQDGLRVGYGLRRIKLPPEAVSAFFTPAEWAAPPKPTHQICFNEDEMSGEGPCPMSATIRSPRSLGGGRTTAWMDGACARTQVNIASKRLKPLPKRAPGPGNRARLGGLGVGLSGGPIAAKASPVPTIPAGKPAYWTDGTTAGKSLAGFALDLTQTFWRKGRVCTRDALGRGKSVGLCFNRAAVRLGPILRGKGAQYLGMGSGVLTAPKIELKSVTGPGSTPSVLRASLIAHLGHLELCQMAAGTGWFGTARVTGKVDRAGRFTQVSADTAGATKKTVSACLSSVLRLLQLKGATAGEAKLTLRFSKPPGVVGDGYGIGLYCRKKTPRVFMSRASVTGGLDAATIRRVIRRHLKELKLCYVNLGLKAKPKLAGMLKIRFTIAADGKVDSASVAADTLTHAPTTKCVLKRVKTWRFPRPEGSKPSVVYPFHFKPTGC